MFQRKLLEFLFRQTCSINSNIDLNILTSTSQKKFFWGGRKNFYDVPSAVPYLKEIFLISLRLSLTITTVIMKLHMSHTSVAGKSPTDLAASLGNPAIVDVLNSFSRYTPAMDSDPRDCELTFQRRSVLPEVRPPCKGPSPRVAPSRAFITAKSHSDPLLLTRVRQRKSLVPEVGMSLGSLSRRQVLPHGGSHEEVRAEIAGHCMDRLSPPPDPAHSQRRGSLSLPDLSLIPRVVLDPYSGSEESEAESCPGAPRQDKCGTSDDSDAVQDLTQEEVLQRMSEVNGRRNSVSLPDLCLKTLTPQKHKTQVSKFSSQGSNSHTDLPSLTKQTERQSHPGNRITDLRLPAITMCNSPSLPALDRKSLRAQGLLKHNSAQNLNLSVRRPIAGDGESLRRLLGRRKDDVVLQSIT